MNISGIEIKHQLYAPSGNSDSKSSSCDGTFESFQEELANWEKRVKETLDKEQDNDNSRNIQMSEKQWRNLIKKVDGAIYTLKDDIKDQGKEAKKQVTEKKQTPKLKVEQSM